MKLYTYKTMAGEQRIGVALGDKEILDLRQAEELLVKRNSGQMLSMHSLIEGGVEALDLARELHLKAPGEAVRSFSDVTLMAPLPVPVRLRDAGFFVEHMEIIAEAMARLVASKMPDPEAGYAELKASGKFNVHEVVYRRVLYYNSNHLAVIGSDTPLEWPLDVEVIDYELELGMVIGKGGSDISASKMRDHVFGYTLMNDWSARDLQMDVFPAGMGPCMGKDFANSLGPCIVTADEIPDPHILEMTAFVNGEEWSRGWTRNMHHNVFEGLAQMSRISPLFAGEVIGSGTPAHGSASEQGKKLAPGDTVELHVPEIGTLRNTIQK